MLLVQAATLRDVTARVLMAGGANAEDARIVAESLVEANLRGHDSHGVFRATAYARLLQQGEVVSGAPLRVVEDGPARIVADAARGFGQVQCRRLIERLIPKAREQGLACGTLRQSGHVGRLGEWAEMVAAQELAVLLAVNDNGVPQFVAPPGGQRGRYSTNPIALGVPTQGEPLVLDVSTSAVANGKITVARNAGRAVPEGWLQDAEGRPTTDPNVMKADPPGALLPFGGDQAYKAFGLAVLFDILVSGLSGGFCPPAPAGTSEFNNLLMVIWDPEKWSGTAHLCREAERFIEHLRSTPLVAGTERIQLPGDRSAACRAERLAHGIPLDRRTWERLEAAGKAGGRN